MALRWPSRTKGHPNWACGPKAIQDNHTHLAGDYLDGRVRLHVRLHRRDRHAQHASPHQLRVRAVEATQAHAGQAVVHELGVPATSAIFACGESDVGNPMWGIRCGESVAPGEDAPWSVPIKRPIRGQSRGRQEANQEANQEAVKRPIKRPIKRPSRGHQDAIRMQSGGHQEAIKRPRTALA
jgi:hypothetical protein